MAMNGTIKRMVSDKGFGFVLAEDGKEYFFHQSACTGTPFDSMRVDAPNVCAFRTARVPSPSLSC